MQAWGAIILAIVLSLAILPQTSLGQIPTPDKLNLDDGPTPQCLDFNQDNVCESLLLANGTMIKNPNNPIEAQNVAINWTDPNTGLQYEIPSQGLYCLDFDGDSVCDIDFENGIQIIYDNQNQDPTLTVKEPDEDDDKDNDRSDPDCWYGNLYVCDEDGKCDSEKFDCLTDCADGSTVTTGEDCPDEDDDSDEPDDESSDLDDDSDNDGDNCQSQDDFCDDDEGCESSSVDCIDDRNFDEDDYDG